MRIQLVRWRWTATATALWCLCFAATSTGQNLTDQDEVAAREARILGHPPRIAPLDPGEYSASAIELSTALRKAINLPATTEISEYVATMLRHPDLLRRQVDFSVQLTGGALPARARELVVLRLAWLCQAPYEWGEHVDSAKRLAGLTSDEVEMITVGSTAPGWSALDRAILRAVEELHADAMISDQTWVVLASELDEQQLIELPILAGFYQSIAYLQNSVRFRLRPENPGLSAR